MNNHEGCYQHDVTKKFEALISEVRQFENLQGLSTPRVYLLIGLTVCWLHTGSDHWITIKATSDQEVQHFCAAYLLFTKADCCHSTFQI